MTCQELFSSFPVQYEEAQKSLTLLGSPADAVASGICERCLAIAKQSAVRADGDRSSRRSSASESSHPD